MFHSDYKIFMNWGYQTKYSLLRPRCPKSGLSSAKHGQYPRLNFGLRPSPDSVGFSLSLIPAEPKPDDPAQPNRDVITKFIVVYLKIIFLISFLRYYSGLRRLFNKMNRQKDWQYYDDLFGYVLCKSSHWFSHLFTVQYG